MHEDGEEVEQGWKGRTRQVVGEAHAWRLLHIRWAVQVLDRCIFLVLGGLAGQPKAHLGIANRSASA